MSGSQFDDGPGFEPRFDEAHGDGAIDTMNRPAIGSMGQPTHVGQPINSANLMTGLGENLGLTEHHNKGVDLDDRAIGLRITTDLGPVALGLLTGRGLEAQGEPRFGAVGGRELR